MENTTMSKYQKFVKIAKIVSCAVSFALMILTLIGIFFVGYKDVYRSSLSDSEAVKSGFFDFFYSKYKDVHSNVKEALSTFKNETDYKINIIMSAYVPLIFTTIVLSVSCVIIIAMIFLALNKIVKALNQEKVADIGKYALFSIVSYIFAILVITGYAYYEGYAEYTSSYSSYRYSSYRYSLTRKFNVPTNIFLSLIVVFGLMLLVLRRFERKIKWNGKKLISFLFSGMSLILLIVIVTTIPLKFSKLTFEEDDGYGSMTYSHSATLMLMVSFFNTSETDFSVKQWSALWQLQMVDNFAFIFGIISLILCVIALIKLFRVFMGRDKNLLDLVLSVTIFVFVLIYSILSIIAIVKMNNFIDSIYDDSYSSTFSFPYQIILVVVFSLCNVAFNIIEYANCYIAKNGYGSKNTEETTSEVFWGMTNNGIKTGEESKVSQDVSDSKQSENLE